jgi:hypothetical protein
MPLMSSQIERRLNGEGSAAPGDGQPWWRRLPWIDIAILVSSGALFFLFYRFCGTTPDEGLITSASERILRGQVPYRDFFSELGPGSLYLQAFIFRLGGEGLRSVFFSVWLLSTILTWLLYRLSRKLLPLPLSLLPPFVLISVTVPYRVLSHHWWGILFFLLMVLSVSPLCGVEATGQTRKVSLRLFVAGMLGVATLFCMQSLGAWAMVTTVIWFVMREKQGASASWRSSLKNSRSSALWFVCGAAVVVGVAAIYFGIKGALGEMVYDNFTFLFSRYVPYLRSNGAYSWDIFTSRLVLLLKHPSPHNLLSGAGFYFFSMLGPAVGLGGAIWQLARRSATEIHRSHLLLLYVLAGAGCFASQLHEPEILHFIWGSPLILVLFVDTWREAALRWAGGRRVLIGAAVLVLVLAVAGESLRAVQVVRANVPLRSRRGIAYVNPRNAATYQNWINTIERDVPPGGETFVFPYEAQLYYLTATRNPTRYDVLLSNFQSARQFSEAMEVLWQKRPEYIFNCSSGEQILYGSESGINEEDSQEPDALAEDLHSGRTPYRLVENAAGMEVWRLKK